jgi:hypothetical protein
LEDDTEYTHTHTHTHTVLEEGHLVAECDLDPFPGRGFLKLSLLDKALNLEDDPSPGKQGLQGSPRGALWPS